MLHGTSNILFSILNIAPSSSSADYDEKARMRRLQVVDQSGGEYYESAPKEEYDDDGDASSSSSTDFENLLSEPASRRLQTGQPMVRKRLPPCHLPGSTSRSVMYLQLPGVY